MSEKRIVNLPELVVTAPRPLRPEILRFSWRSMTSPPVAKDTWATSTLLVRAELRKTSLVLVGCFQAYGDENGSQTERVIGPFRSEASAAAARDAVEAALALPRVPQRVSAHELRADPARFDGMVVETTGPWSKGFERSSFAGAWLIGPLGSGASAGAGAVVQVRACGFWHCKDDEDNGYGHLGASRAELVAYEVAPLPPKPEAIAKVELDGVVLTFEQNGDYDEWRVVAAGVPLPMLFKETDDTRPEAARLATHVPVAWLPLETFLGLREPFAIYRSPEGTRARCSHRNKPVDIQGTACYSGETLTLTLDGSGRAVRVTLHHDFDASA